MIGTPGGEINLPTSEADASLSIDLYSTRAMRAELRKLYKNYAAKPHQCCRRARSPRRHGRGGERRRRHHGTLGRGSGSMPTRPSSPRRVSIGRRRAAGPHWPGRHRRPHIHSARCTATGSRRRIARCEPSWTRRTLGYDDDTPHAIRLDLADLHSKQQKPGHLYLTMRLTPEAPPSAGRARVADGGHSERAKGSPRSSPKAASPGKGPADAGGGRLSGAGSDAAGSRWSGYSR